MDVGNFYFIKDEYFVDFPDGQLMSNKEGNHNRPCFYAMYDSKTSIYWLIPISSQVSKFKRIYQDKIHKYKKCDTIIFGEVLGYEKAFLIQNMFPIIPSYIQNEYIDKNAGIPVTISGPLEKELISKAKKVLALQRKGIKLILPNVLTIESALIEQLKATV